MDCPWQHGVYQNTEREESFYLFWVISLSRPINMKEKERETEGGPDRPTYRWKDLTGHSCRWQLNMSLGKYLGHMKRDAGFLEARTRRGIVRLQPYGRRAVTGCLREEQLLLSITFTLQWFGLSGIVFVSHAGEIELSGFWFDVYNYGTSEVLS